MDKNAELYNQYDLLLPPKFDGGYLIILLHEKIKNGFIEQPFTYQQIEETLVDISRIFRQDSVRQWARIKDNLLHYFIMNYPDEPGKYFLTDYAYNVIELMLHKLDSPYKDHPLKKSFERSFYIKIQDIRSIDDLERQFDRLFISGPKKIVADHLSALEDELKEAYLALNNILSNDNETAAVTVREFATTFKKFGSKAEDIKAAMASKDKFLRDFQLVIDNFYGILEDTKFSEDSLANQRALSDWEKAKNIFRDITDFFADVDHKITRVRRRINNASEKLSELQEHFSARANYRLQIQKMLIFLLNAGRFSEEGLVFDLPFPLKAVVFARPRLLFLRHGDFDNDRPNVVINVAPDTEYEALEKNKINTEVMEEETVRLLVQAARLQLTEERSLSIPELMQSLLDSGHGLALAYRVAAELTSTLQRDGIDIEVHRQVASLQQNEMSLWKTTIKQ